MPHPLVVTSFEELARLHPVCVNFDPVYWTLLLQLAACGDGVAQTVLAHGTHFIPGEPVPGLQGPKKACFANAARLCLASPAGIWRYAEGYACTPHVALPIHHAWLLGSDGRVVDPTWDAGECYYGVVVETADLAARVSAAGGIERFGPALSFRTRGLLSVPDATIAADEKGDRTTAVSRNDFTKPRLRAMRRRPLRRAP